MDPKLAALAESNRRFALATRSSDALHLLANGRWPMCVTTELRPGEPQTTYGVLRDMSASEQRDLQRQQRSRRERRADRRQRQLAWLPFSA